MPGIADLVNNIKDSVSNLLGKSDAKGNLYPKEAPYTSVQSHLNPESWIKLSFPYTFSVVNLKDAAYKENKFKDFELPLAPQAITQSEEPAINIKPSQGGTTVNHNGMGYKMLNIQGTTGIAPFRGDGGVDRKTGEAIFQPDQLKFKSGYEVFIHLRNWFRTYYEWKSKQGEAGKNIRLVFKNYKDGEFLIVELLKFDMERQAAKSFLYDYKLEFKVLSHLEYGPVKPGNSPWDKADSLIDGALNKINKARGIFLRTQGILRQVESTYNASVLEPMRAATLAMKAALGVPLVAADIGSRAIVNTVSTAGALAIVAREVVNTATLGATGKSQTLSEIDGLLDKRLYGTKNTLAKTYAAVETEIKQKGSAGMLKLGALTTRMDAGQFPDKTLAATQNEQDQAAALPRSFYENTIAELERVKKNAEDFFNLGSSDYDDIFDRTSTLNADSSKVVTQDEYDILFAFNEAISGLTLLLSTTDMFKSSLDARIQDMNTRFNGSLALISHQAVQQIKLDAGMTLEKLAQIYLGDSTRWGEIVEANNLKAPYVSLDPNESRDGVLKAGSNILIPTSIQNGFSQAPEGKINKLTQGMTELEKSLGVDLMVNKDFDLVLTSSGDFELIAGANNMAQGTFLKLSYEPGEVMLYPELGSGIRVGRKFPPIEDLADRISSSLLQDSRVSKVSDISLIRDNSAMHISFNLHVKQVDIPIPIKIKV